VSKQLIQRQNIDTIQDKHWIISRNGYTTMTTLSLLLSIQ